MTDICQFFELFVLGVLISCYCAVNYEAGLFLVVDQRDVRQIVKQMLVSLDGNGPKGFWRNFFLVLATSFYCAQDFTQHI